jgi:hypothetical protein
MPITPVAPTRRATRWVALLSISVHHCKVSGRPWQEGDPPARPYVTKPVKCELHMLNSYLISIETPNNRSLHPSSKPPSNQSYMAAYAKGDGFG